MEASDYLLTLAEVAVAFVGFAAIVLSLRERSEGPAPDGSVALGWLVERGLAALFFSLLPLLLGFLDVPPEIGWRASSGLLSCYLVYAAYSSLAERFRYSERVNPVGAANYYARFSASLLVLISQAMAAADLLPALRTGIYLLGCTWLLVLAAMIFTTILRRRAA